MVEVESEGDEGGVRRDERLFSILLDEGVTGGHRNRQGQEGAGGGKWWKGVGRNLLSLVSGLPCPSDGCNEK